MKTAKAFAPGNVSCIFVIKKVKNHRNTVSLGLGFTVNKGAIVTIKKINNIKKNNKLNFNKKIKNNNKLKNMVYYNTK